MEDLRTEHEVENALLELRAQRPELRRAVVKLNDSFSGEGNALFRYPGGREPRPPIREALQQLEFAVPTRDARRSTSTSSRAWAASWRSSSRRREKHSPSAQLRVEPAGRGHAHLHPRPDPGRAQRPGVPGLQLPGRTTTTGWRVQDGGRSASATCWPATAWSAASPWTSWSAATSPTAEWKLTALEINLRMGGTTHPYLALQFLTGGQLDPRDGPVPLAHRPRQVLPRHRQPAAPSTTGACCPRT